MEVPQRVLDAARSIDILPELLERVPEAVSLVNLWRKDMIDRGRMDDEDSLNEALGVATVVATWAQNGVIAARVRAEERQRVLAEMERPAFMQAVVDRAQLTHFTDDDGHDVGVMPGSHAAVAIIAARTALGAGAAVPVATLEHLDLVGIGEAAAVLGVSKQRVHQLSATEAFPEPVARLAAGPVWLRPAVAAYAAVRLDRRHREPVPVATREPVDEVVCPNCETRIRARMSDAPEVAAEPMESREVIIARWLEEEAAEFDDGDADDVEIAIHAHLERRAQDMRAAAQPEIDALE